MNYQNELKKIINELNYRPTLLLHSCCGPCSTQVLSYLEPYFDITVLYYNPNIEPESEYLHRKEEQIRFIKEFNKPNVKFMDADYENELFREKIEGLEDEIEGGIRCPICFLMRLEYTAKKAKELGYEYFGTTLTVSPHKNSKQINIIGALLQGRIGVKYLYSDFKKEDGYKKSIELSHKYNLYRQNYCGCLMGVNNDKNN